MSFSFTPKRTKDSFLKIGSLWKIDKANNCPNKKSRLFDLGDGKIRAWVEKHFISK